MKLTRRNFLLSLAGGLVGINLTPLPWKLMDDISIWTQNWPWVPVPERGRFYHEKSVCTLCQGGCGIKIRKVDGVKDDRAVKIEGREDFPVNRGGICPIGAGGLQLLYDESLRFTSPMKRAGLRGSGNFLNISWDEALEILAKRIIDLRQKGSPEKIVAIDGNRKGSTVSLLIERLMKAIGSPNYIRVPDMEDTYSVACILMCGREYPLSFDLENSDYILSFGCGLIDGWLSPGRVISAWSMWHGELKEKVKVVQIDSRASDTASKATEWIAIKPGTETALALGLCHVIVKEGIYDRDFVKRWTFGFEDWIDEKGNIHMGFKNMVLKRYDPEKVSEITGVPASRIVSVAREFAKARAPVAIFGREKGDLPGSTYEYMAILALNALVGSINRPGGILLQDPVPLKSLPEVPLDRIAKEGLKRRRIDRAGEKEAPFTHSLIYRLSEEINRSKRSPVELLLVFSANPSYTLPDGGEFKKALRKIPFIVSFSPFKDETALMSDLILPDHTYLEKMDEVVWPKGIQYPAYLLSKQAVKPVYNTRHCGDVIIELAKRIGLSKAFPWRSFEDVVKYRAKGLYEAKGRVSWNGEPPWKIKRVSSDYRSFDEMWEKLKDGGLWYKPSDVYGKYEFMTPSKRFEFFSQTLMNYKDSLKDMGIKEEGDVAFMPHFEEEDYPEDYPYRMVIYEMINLSSSWIPSPPFVYKTIFDNQLLKDENFADINPKTAKELGIKQGDRILLTSPSGKIKLRANLTHIARPGCVYVALGFGHTGYDEFIKGKGENPNWIVWGKRDPISGYKIWWSVPVKISKA